MNKIFNVVFALVLFGMTANAAEVVTAWTNNNYTQVPTNPGEKNKANSGIDTWTSLSDGVAMITGKAKNEMNIPSEQILKLQAEYISEVTGQTVTASEVKGWYQNGEYEIWTPATWTSITGEKPTNFGTDVANAKLFVSEVYDPNANLLVLRPKSLPGWSFASLKEGCLNYQEGSFYEPTGDSDSDYSLPQSGSDATATATAIVGDVDVTVYTGEESSDEGGNTYIENYYEAGSGYENYGYQPDPSLYWSLGLGWSQCGGWSFGAGLSNSPYGVGGYNSGYGGYNSGYSCGFNDYNCGSNGGGGFYDYSTTNNYYGDYNSNNNNTSYWNSFNRPIKNITYNGGGGDTTTTSSGDDDLPSNTGGIGNQPVSGDGMPGNNAGTTTGKQPSGFKKDYKKSQQKGDDVYYASAEDKKDEGTKAGNQSKSYDKKDQVKEQSDGKNFEKKSEPKQEVSKPAEKQFEKKQPVKQNTTSNSKPKTEEKKKTNVDKNYDTPSREYQKKKSPEAKKPAPKKEVKKQPVKKSTTVKDSGAKVKPNSSAKKSSGKSYKANSGTKQGNGQNYSNKGNGNRQKGSNNSGSRNSGSSSRRQAGR